jgi:hypothetical protein
MSEGLGYFAGAGGIADADADPDKRAASRPAIGGRPPRYPRPLAPNADGLTVPVKPPGGAALGLSLQPIAHSELIRA